MEARRTLWPLLPLLLLFAPACDNSTEPGGGSGTDGRARLSGTVTIAPDGVPLAGAKVALVNPLPYQVVAGPVLTDSDGRYSFTSAPNGNWYCFVFGDSVLMQNTADAKVMVGRFTSARHDIRMIRSQLWGSDPRRITGKVTDAQTGRPIQGAYVSGLIGQVNYSFVGITLDSEDVTDADGRYSVAPLYVLTNAGMVVHPLAVSKEGYAPFAIEDVALPPDPDSLRTLDVGLQRPGNGATLRGRIVNVDGDPVADIAVALDFSDVPIEPTTVTLNEKNGDDPQRVPLLGKVVRTNAQGRFEVRDLTPGTYFVDPAYLPDDGYVTGYDDNGSFRVTGTEVVDIGDIHVVAAIKPIAPANGEIVHGARPTLRWSAVPGATRYVIAMGSDHFLDYGADSSVPEYTLPESNPPGPDIRWLVTAFRPAMPFDERIAEFEAIQVFTMEE